MMDQNAIRPNIFHDKTLLRPLSFVEFRLLFSRTGLFEKPEERPMPTTKTQVIEMLATAYSME